MKGMVCTVLALLLTCAAWGQRVVKVPVGTPVLIDGKISPGEWKDAAAVALPNKFGTLYFKQSGGFVDIAVELADQNQLAAVDLYVDASPSDVHYVYDLHASAKLGERQHLGSWPEWKWWNNDRWTANVARPDTFEPLKFLNEPNREFQILRSRFPAKYWSVMFEITTNVRPGRGDKHVFPAGASSDVASNDWYRLQLD